MRTTVELPEDMIAALHALAVRKGQRGYSKVMEEAVAYFIEDQEKKDRDRASVLKMKGTWAKSEADETRERIEELRKNWKD